MRADCVGCPSWRCISRIAARTHCVKSAHAFLRSQSVADTPADGVDDVRLDKSLTLAIPWRIIRSRRSFTCRALPAGSVDMVDRGSVVFISHLGAKRSCRLPVQTQNARDKIEQYRAVALIRVIGANRSDSTRVTP